MPRNSEIKHNVYVYNKTCGVTMATEMHNPIMEEMGVLLSEKKDA
jgi:hypothetical protein